MSLQPLDASLSAISRSGQTSSLLYMHRRMCNDCLLSQVGIEDAVEGEG